MAELFYIRIIASDKVFYEGKVQAFVGTTMDGEFEFLAHHEEEIVALNVGTFRYKDAEGNWIKAVSGLGVAQYANNRCTILVDTCEKPEDIDRKRAQAALERAREQIRQNRSQAEYYVAQASLARALTRLKETFASSGKGPRL
ncbi:MAG: F0F1 ATP synthase subunit epsilon [Lachnospiraceae bacterium]|nr:F0F1 ATP synthase subunit epsilon [Lachnospiraceae bacterium]